MLDAYFEALPIALGLILATLPVFPVPILLAARPRAGALVGFLLGWGIGFGLVGLVVIGFADLTAPGPADPAEWVVWLRLVLGLALIGFGTRKWRNRPVPGTEPDLPGWMARLEGMGPLQALGAGVLLVVLNPKNVVLVASGALAIAAVTYAAAAQALAMLGFTVTASLGLAAPLLLRLLLGEAAARPLASLKTFIAAKNPAILALVLMALGLVLAVNAVLEILV